MIGISFSYNKIISVQKKFALSLFWYNFYTNFIWQAFTIPRDVYKRQPGNSYCNYAIAYFICQHFCKVGLFPETEATRNDTLLQTDFWAKYTWSSVTRDDSMAMNATLEVEDLAITACRTKRVGGTNLLKAQRIQWLGHLG